MKIYLKQNVWDAALERIRWLFREFPHVIAAVSGGKDSTVIFYLCLQVARELNRLPLTVMFIDQEAEWQATVDQVRAIMYHPDVRPRWYQMPIRLFNATSATDHWLHCWDPAREADWVHPKDAVSVKENIYGTDRFHELFRAIIDHEYDGPAAYVAGVRTDESPTRFMALTHTRKYKWATWGAQLNKRRRHYTFYPIYDWTFSDVWKAIHDNGWPYNRIYDLQYQHGLPQGMMRVSNVHHETSVYSLFYLQEAEPATYERIVQRLHGIDMAAKLGARDYFTATLPYMFTGWREYRDYLLAHLINNDDWRRKLASMFQRDDAALGETLGVEKYVNEIHSILCNDWEGIIHGHFYHRPEVNEARRRYRGEAAWTG